MIKLLSVLLLLPWVVQATTYYVATNGNDGWVGSSLLAPFRTIQHGVDQLGPGDELVIKGGTYNEGVTMTASGTPSGRITVRSADGELAVINCSVQISGWHQSSEGDLFNNPNWANIYYADLNTNTFSSELNIFRGRWNYQSPPLKLFVDITNSLGYMSRWPNGTSARWHTYLYESQTGDSNFVDTVNLTQTDPNYWIGALMCVHSSSPDNTYEEPIVAFDPDLHSVTTKQDIDLHSGATHDLSPANTQYFIENSPATIDEWGDWAVDVVNYPGRLYVMWPDNLSGHSVQTAYRTYGFFGDGVSYVTLHGVQVEMAMSTSIRFEDGVSNIVEWCSSVSGTGGGIIMNSQEGSVIRNSLTERVNNGLNISLSQNCAMSNNMVTLSLADGIDIKSSTNVVVQGNVIRDTWFEQHPDGYQHFGDNPAQQLVWDIKLFDNVFYNVGQGIQASHGRYLVVSNNVFAISHWSSMLSISGYRADVWMATHLTAPDTCNNMSNSFFYNTILDGAKGFGAFGNRQGNIIIPPSAAGSSSMGPAAGMTGVQGWSDYNVMWDRPGSYDNMQWRNDAGSISYFDLPSQWATYTSTSGQDTHGAFSDPLFMNAPVLRLLLDTDAYTAGTTNSLVLDSATGINLGGYIEIDGDGVARQVTNIVGTTISFSPGYYNKILGRQTVNPVIYSWPDAQTRVFYWGSNGTNLLWDTRLQVGSPALSLGTPRQAGSTLNVQNYLNGDFDGDGNRDVPVIGVSSGGYTPEVTEELKINYLRVGS